MSCMTYVDLMGINYTIIYGDHIMARGVDQNIGTRTHPVEIKIELGTSNL